MTSPKHLALPLALIGLPLASLCCKQPMQPAGAQVQPVDASESVRAIQRDEARAGEQVRRLARSQAGQDLNAAMKVAATTVPDEHANPDAGMSTGLADSEIAGKLERASPNRLIIRDGTGFEYWLEASESTHVTANGTPARLTDLKQGTEVRAQFLWQGKDRVATAIDVVGDATERDGGVGPPRTGG